MFGFNKLTALLGMLLMLLTACGNDNHSNKSNSQVIAKVNGDEISVHQVNMLMARAGNVSEAESKGLTKKIADKLITEQLLVQKAIENKLDRDPQVLQALQASKKKVLAQAYIEKFLLKNTKPSTAEVDQFYSEHPELFSERRIFRLQELVVQNSAEQIEKVKSLIAGKNNMTEIAQLLKDSGFQFSVNANVRAAEQLPGGFLNKLQTIQDGGIVLVTNGALLNIVKVAESQSKPISKENAVPVIEKYLVNKTKAKTMQAEIEALKNNAEIEYLGAFSDMQMADSVSAAADNPTDKSALTSDSTEDKANDADGELSLEKGLAGF